MKAMVVAAGALALALAGTALAAQQVPMGRASGQRQHLRARVAWDAALVRPQRRAIRVAGRLERREDRNPARLKADVDRLGQDLASAEGALAQLQRSAVGTEKT